MNKIKECVDTIRYEIDNKIEFVSQKTSDTSWVVKLIYDGRTFETYPMLREPKLDVIKRQVLKQVHDSYKEAKGRWKGFINEIILEEGGNNE